MERGVYRNHLIPTLPVVCTIYLELSKISVGNLAQLCNWITIFQLELSKVYRVYILLLDCGHFITTILPFSVARVEICTVSIFMMGTTVHQANQVSLCVSKKETETETSADPFT